MDEETPKAKALGIFRAIRDAFPHLEMEFAESIDRTGVDAELHIPAQASLRFDVNLNLQGDELHLNAGALWAEWFPITDAHVVARYEAAARGLLSGEFRINEHIRGGRAVKAELQEPVGSRWRRVASWSQLHLPLPWRKTYRILRNTANPS